MGMIVLPSLCARDYYFWEARDNVVRTGSKQRRGHSVRDSSKTGVVLCQCVYCSKYDVHTFIHTLEMSAYSIRQLSHCGLDQNSQK